MEYPKELPASLIEALQELMKNPSPEAVKKINEIKDKELQTNEVYRNFVEQRQRDGEELARERMIAGNPYQFNNEMTGQYKAPENKLVIDNKPSTQIVCCPSCFRLDEGNTTNKLNRKKRRSNPVIGEYRAHETAYCFHCSSRMIYIDQDIRVKKMEERYMKLIQRTT